LGGSSDDKLDITKAPTPIPNTELKNKLHPVLKANKPQIKEKNIVAKPLII
jgi:hypothetical protein